MDIKYLASQV